MRCGRSIARGLRAPGNRGFGSGWSGCGRCGYDFGHKPILANPATRPAPEPIRNRNYTLLLLLLSFWFVIPVGNLLLLLLLFLPLLLPLSLLLSLFVFRRHPEA